MRIEIPKWLWAVIVIEMLPMFLGPLAALTRPEVLGGPGADSIIYAAYFYAARNVAVGIAFLFACYLRSASMLFILIVIRLLTDLVDLPVFLAFDLAESNLRLILIFVFVCYVPAFFGLRFLWRAVQPEVAKAV